MLWFRKMLYWGITRKDWPDEAQLPPLKELRETLPVGLALFSDTVLLYTLTDDEENYQRLLRIIAWMMFATMHVPNLRLRVGVSHGEIHIDLDNELFLGQPIVDAYLLQEAQDWSGGALTEEAAKKVPEQYRNGEHPLEWPVRPYEIPLKECRKRNEPDPDHRETVFVQRRYSKNMLAVDWTIGIHDSPFLEWSPSSSDPPSSVDERIAEKYRQTKCFHDHVCFWCRNQGLSR
jgi:hypothetical protein